MYHNIEPIDRRYKSIVLDFFCDWCFVTIPSYLDKDPGDEEYKKIYI